MTFETDSKVTVRLIFHRSKDAPKATLYGVNFSLIFRF